MRTPFTADVERAVVARRVRDAHERELAALRERHAAELGAVRDEVEQQLLARLQQKLVALSGGRTSNLPFRLRSFRHGIHPDDHKQGTEHLPVEHMPFVERYVLPLGMGGKPARPVVQRGQRVRAAGQCSQRPTALSRRRCTARWKASSSSSARQRHPNGELVPCVELQADAFSPQQCAAEAPVDPGHASTSTRLVAHVQRGGIVGLGGAAFLAHVTYKAPADKPVKHFVLNGCECEPPHSDLRPPHDGRAADDVLRGARIVACLARRG
ncbi:MAG: hypothetical protein H6835_01870 [Planctomycetes bacterium]|nr:hypothetical protein [Planctomycetota bacterium]